MSKIFKFKDILFVQKQWSFETNNGRVYVTLGFEETTKNLLNFIKTKNENPYISFNANGNVQYEFHKMGWWKVKDSPCRSQKSSKLMEEAEKRRLSVVLKIHLASSNNNSGAYLIERHKRPG